MLLLQSLNKAKSQNVKVAFELIHYMKHVIKNNYTCDYYYWYIIKNYDMFDNNFNKLKVSCSNITIKYSGVISHLSL